MENIKRESFYAPYPVGRNFKEAQTLADQLYDEFLRILDSYIPLKREFDRAENIRILARGSSGAILSALVASKLGKDVPEKVINIHHIKKPGEGSHTSADGSCSQIRSSDFVMIIDDMMATGETMNTMIETFINCRCDSSKKIDLIITADSIADAIRNSSAVKYIY